MRSFDSRTGIERLDPDECLRFLESDEIGRFAYTVGGSPVIVPVNYRMDGDSVVFRTGAGMKLDMGRRSPVSFEIDSFDRELRSGWSVVVSGWLEEVLPNDVETYQRIHELPIDPWAPGEKDHWVRIRTSRITGRRVGP